MNIISRQHYTQLIENYCGKQTIIVLIGQLLDYKHHAPHLSHNRSMTIHEANDMLITSHMGADSLPWLVQNCRSKGRWLVNDGTCMSSQEPHRNPL